MSLKAKILALLGRSDGQFDSIHTNDNSDASFQDAFGIDEQGHTIIRVYDEGDVIGNNTLYEDPNTNKLFYKDSQGNSHTIQYETEE